VILISQQGLGIDHAPKVVLLHAGRLREGPWTYSITFRNERTHSARGLRIPAQHIVGAWLPATRAGEDVRVTEALHRNPNSRRPFLGQARTMHGGISSPSGAGENLNARLLSTQYGRAKTDSGAIACIIELVYYTNGKTTRVFFFRPTAPGTFGFLRSADEFDYDKNPCQLTSQWPDQKTFIRRSMRD
jgi:hypothetical protein